ncbi:AAA family ATPase [Nitratiruptor sp. SB155-2]|uniref:AAA family ATPase n=1 Tax=Nitratiruptor sp. (strain SB155-2) TaxID=387092 RepID=UPI000158740C|nr:AAA family ATPase [Nitratiruptor sp. SB155-2]BAF70786.1 conserved hypothetical protein [Nitratiruptor sp. SB155-2]
MKFKRITIENMFSYRGNISFYFSNSEKPIILIIGENGFGKTSFINSVKIGLHGLTKDILNIGSTTLSKQDFILGNPLKNFSGILNRNAKRAGENFCKVFIELEDDEILKIERSFLIHSKSFVEKLAVYDHEDILIAEDDEAQDIINSKISPYMQKFFFFDGEKIQTIADFSHDEFKQMLEDVLDLNIYDQIVLDSLTLARKINKEELDSEIVNKLDFLEEEYKKKQVELEKIEKDLSSENEILKDLEKERNLLNNKIKHIKNRLTKQLDEKKEKLTKENEKLKDLLIKFKNISFLQLPLLLNSELLNRVKNDIEENYQDRISINEKTLIKKKEQLLSKIDKSEEKEKISKIFDEVFKAKSDDLSVLFADPLKVEMQFYSLPHINISQLLYEISQTKDQIKLLEMEIFDLEKKVEENNKELFDSHLQNLNNLSQMIGKQKEKIENLNQKIEKLNTEIKSLKREIGQYSVREFNNSIVMKKIETLNGIIEVVKFIKQEIKKEKRAQLEKTINEKFKMLKKENYEADRIILDDDFHINLVDKNNNPLDILSSSSGQKQIIATALIWGISQFISQDIPMIIDTPLGRLDDKNQSLILNKFYPNAASQVIILPTPSELRNPAFKNLEPLISETFILHNNGSATSVEKIGNKYIFQKFKYQPKLEIMS